MTTKLSDLIRLVTAYERAQWSPSRSSVVLGCGCGCGGDSYTFEQWYTEKRIADNAIRAMKLFCKKHGFEYDLDESDDNESLAA